MKRGGAILPIGGLVHGHKGFGLSLLVEALTQGLSGYGRADRRTVGAGGELRDVPGRLVAHDQDAAVAEHGVAAIVDAAVAVDVGLAEPDGMHTTPTVDYAIVLDGEIWLELDEGRSTLLRRHDVVIQNGTRHAWRNKSERAATVAFVLIGATGQMEHS